MSSAAVSVAWDSDLPPLEKLVLLAIADQSCELQCKTSLESVAASCGMSIDETRGHIEFLLRHRYLSVDFAKDFADYDLQVRIAA